MIQPIVLTRDNKLIAGGRRLKALTRLGIKELIHSKHFVYNDEADDYRLKTMELEENLRRKNLTWVEEILAKKKLLEIYQSIHGTSRSGAPSRSDSLGLTSSGFGVNKLAAMLGESNAQTSKDLELAELITVAPQLARAETKEAARRQAVLAVVVAKGLAQQASNPQPPTDKKWTLYEGDFQQNAYNLGDASVDLVIVDPPYGEDIQGMAANSRQLLGEAFVDSLGETTKLLRQMCHEAYRCLKSDTFGVFFFGFSVYSELVDSLRFEGFDVDTTPLVWVKNTVINTSPYTRYGRSYEPILIARKGSPKLVRPSQRDVISEVTTTMVSLKEQKYYQAQKPVPLIGKFIMDMTIKDALVCDFCAGSGTAGVAALELKRRAVLFERDPTACQIIRSRLGGL